MYQLKLVRNDLFEDLPDFNIFTLKFHLLEQIEKDVYHFKNLHFLG